MYAYRLGTPRARCLVEACRPAKSPARHKPTAAVQEVASYLDQPKEVGSGHLAKICQIAYLTPMSTMNISLPESLKSFVDEQVTTRGFGTSSEYIRELIRKDLDRQRLRGLLLQGAQSVAAAPADAGYFEGLRNQIRSRRTR